ncbi:MAG: hypothetical protein C0507_03255 [Cyanobacteria bacterium PR.3.49]|nr:hypothetical protein [Cyanobacteria bacterium PR.3.49]
MCIPVLSTAAAALLVLYFAAPYIVNLLFPTPPPRRSNVVYLPTADPAGARPRPRLSHKEERRNAQITKGELLACTLIGQVEKQIEEIQRTSDFEVKYHAEVHDEVLRMAILILKNSGWEARDKGENTLVLTHFDPHDVDRLFILRGRDKVELEDARRPNGEIPRVRSFDELMKNVDHEAVSTNIAERVVDRLTKIPE